MHITLIRIGGIIPMTKKAETDVDWSESEMDNLLNVIKVSDEDPGQRRDATGYQLISTAGTFSIDLEKVPAKYTKTFEELKENLAIVKPGS